MLGALAEGTLRRPGVTLVAAIAVLAAAAGLAAGTPDRLPVLGSLVESEDPAGPELVLVTRGRERVRSPVYRTALEVIAAGIAADPLVTDVRQGPTGDDRRTTTLLVRLDPDADASEREEAAERVVGALDPGPLEVLPGGSAPVAEAARETLESDLAELELLAAPLVLLILVMAGGWRVALAAGLAAGISVLGAISLLRLLGELPAAGIGVAAGVGLVGGIEVVLALVRRLEAKPCDPDAAAALARAMGRSTPALRAAGLGAVLAALATLAVDVPLGASVAVAGALATTLAMVASVSTAPAVLSRLRETDDDRRAGTVSRPPRRLRLDRRLFGNRLVVAGLLAVAVAALVAAAIPFAGSDPIALDAGGLPPDSDPAQAHALAKKQLAGDPALADFKPAAPGDLVERLAVTGGIVVLVVAALCFAVSRRPALAIVLGAVALLPAGAALGLLELVFGDGRLKEFLDYAPQRGPHAAAAITTAAILLVISALRCVRAAPLLRRGEWPRGRAARLRRVRRLERIGIAPAAVASALGALGLGVLAGSDLLPAKELGLAVAAGLLLDLVLVRCLIVPALLRLAP